MVGQPEDQRIKEIFEAHYSPLCNYAQAITKDSMIAEDIIQNIFVQLWQSNKLNEIENIERYLLKAAKFKCIDYLRGQGKKIFLSLNDENFEQNTTTHSELREEDIEPMLCFFAAKLPPKTREVFLQSRIEKKKYKEIAEDCGISVKTVENQMARALGQMRQLLKEHNFLSILLFL